jgi:predicted amidophosphoribosyltransferase
LVSKEVAHVRRTIESRCGSSSKMIQFWKKTRESDLWKIIKQRIGKEIQSFIEQSQKKEWDQLIIRNLEQDRRRNPNYDQHLATMIWYNEEISEEERCRRGNIRGRKVW